MAAKRIFPILLISFIIVIAGCTEGGDSKSGSEDSSTSALGIKAGSKAAPQPSDDAFLRPGPVGDGSFVLPNGRMVKPAGEHILTQVFAIDAAVSPDGNTAVVATTKSPSVAIYDVITGEITQEFTEEVNHTFTGITFNAAGDRFWVSGGGDHSILEFDLIGGTAVFLRRIPLAGWPSGLVLSNDEKYIYTALYMNKRMIKVKLSNGKEMASYPTHMYPYDVAVSANEKRAFVSNVTPGSVTVYDLTTHEMIEEIKVGEHPEELRLSPNGQRLYVANTDSDSISVIDTSTLTVVDTWDLHDDQVLTMGAMPLSIDITPDGSTMYVACAGYDSVDVIDTSDGKILGRIPTGWYPTNAAIDPIKGNLFIANGKGVGSAGGINNVKWPGALQVLPIPDAVDLSLYTQTVEDGIYWAYNFFGEWVNSNFDSPIPTEYGVRSDQIKHVVFIMKENKTYDQVLGDLEGTEGDMQYNLFGEEVTPNTHALARRFVNCDNFYVEGDISVIGHIWATYNSVNDHMEKAFLAGPYPLPEMDPASIPPTKTIFQKILDHDMEFRAYGQAIGFTQDIERMAPYIDLHYGFWNMGTSDEHQKAEEIIREWEQDIFPDFIYIILPNDHNYGGSAGTPTPRYMMGDNDAGLGKLIDWISHSKYWDETVVFVTEDDPQSGSDHIDPHRTIALVISPWAKSNHLSSVLYSQSSIWHTIELILGLPPSSKFDQFASPMFDCFTMQSNSAPYNYIPNPIPFELNGEDKFGDLFCKKPNFLIPDGAPGMGRVLWAMYKPGEPFPASDSVDYCEWLEEEEGEDEDEEVIFYVDAVNELIAYGKKKGITVPVPEGWDELTARVEATKKLKADMKPDVDD